MFKYAEYTIQGITFHYECEYYDDTSILVIDKIDKNKYGEDLENATCGNPWNIIALACEIADLDFTEDIKKLKPPRNMQPDYVNKPIIVNKFYNYESCYKAIIGELTGSCDLVYTVNNKRVPQKEFYNIIKHKQKLEKGEYTEDEYNMYKKEEKAIRTELINKPHELFNEMDKENTVHIILGKYFVDITITKIPDINPARYSFIETIYKK